ANLGGPTIASPEEHGDLALAQLGERAVQVNRLLERFSRHGRSVSHAAHTDSAGMGPHPPDAYIDHPRERRRARAGVTDIDGWTCSRRARNPAELSSATRVPLRNRGCRTTNSNQPDSRHHQ